MSRSRCTFASTEAAEMLGTRASPSITASTRSGRQGVLTSVGPSGAGFGLAANHFESLVCMSGPASFLLPLVHCSPGASNSGGRLQPSTSTQSGLTFKACTLLAMAPSAARRMFASSISATEDSAIAHTVRPSNLGSVSSLNASSRCAAVICFESKTESSNLLTSLSLCPAGKTAKAAATTGPARGPRPASSVPATTEVPFAQNLRSQA
mmetsp:Transcript_21847/g.62421  ORF Transcript_21847/g.62421 Transcript_21847/m.62421 type:complete len:209 (-) Transcript_21847:150-776(-)